MGKDTKRSLSLSAYIFLYNVILFTIHLMIFLKLVNASKSGTFDYHDHFPLFCIGTAAQLLDLIHGVFGITRTGIIAGLIQVFGRLFILFLIEGNPNIHNWIFTPILLFAWVLIELFRYPYYALRAWNIDVYALTWLRYSAWIPLYPIGLSIEWLSMVMSLKYYYETGKYSIHVPYLDVSVNFALIIGVLAFGVMPFIIRKLLGHMKKQRMNKFNVKKIK